MSHSKRVGRSRCRWGPTMVSSGNLWGTMWEVWAGGKTSPREKPETRNRKIGDEGQLPRETMWPSFRAEISTSHSCRMSESTSASSLTFVITSLGGWEDQRSVLVGRGTTWRQLAVWPGLALRYSRVEVRRGPRRSANSGNEFPGCSVPEWTDIPLSDFRSIDVCRRQFSRSHFRRKLGSCEIPFCGSPRTPSRRPRNSTRDA